jgi:small subunit ribosomal protein S19e
MVSVQSVEPSALIKKVAVELKKIDLIQPPEWAKFVKTGVFKQRPPIDEDWWYVRAASILRAVFLLGPVGTIKLRTKYGGKQNRGVRPEKFRVGSGNIIRTILQQLEQEGLVMQNKNPKKKGRVITGKGQSLLEKAAITLYKETEASKIVPVEKATKKEEVVEEPKEESEETPTEKVEEEK